MAKRATNADSKTALLIWSVVCVPLLVYCGGKSESERGESSGAQGGSGGYVVRGGGTGGSKSGGIGGHTGSCTPGACRPGCFNYPSCLPTGGTGGQGGSYGGLGGHTSDCASMGGCRPWCGDSCSGTAGEGGDMGLGGEDTGQGGECTTGPCSSVAGQGGGGQGGGGQGGAGDAGTSPTAGVAGTSSANRRFSEPSERRACYTLPGYQDDPCLPPDDAIVPWLAVPVDCDARVSGGPFPAFRAGSRQCCYAVTCSPFDPAARR